MSVWLVVPVRSLADGKRRLAPALEPAKRSALVGWLLERTLDCAAEFPGLARTLVVSPCGEARRAAERRGARAIADAGAGLNAALAGAQAAVAALGGTHMLAVSSDLPSLGADDLRCCAEAASATTIAIAPDRARQGTNAICVPAATRFAFSFGPDSFARHLDRARSLGLQATIVDRAALAFDVDFPADLSQLSVLEAVVGHH